MRDPLQVVLRLLGDLDIPFHSAAAAEIRHELDDVEMLLRHYLLPRLERPSAPLLIAVVGSTGVGKSAIVNALARDAVSPVGVLRPTTRAPVLVHHPADSQWYERDDGLGERWASAEIPPGVALVDTPPLGAVRGPERLAAVETRTRADLWLLTTTAARYADAVPWRLLAEAARRRLGVAVVVNRIPSEAAQEIYPHVAELLVGRSLGDAPLFAVEEVPLDGSGEPPSPDVRSLAGWLAELAGDDDREAAVRRSVDGAVDSVLGRATEAVSRAPEDVFDETARAALLDALTVVRKLREAAG